MVPYSHITIIMTYITFLNNYKVMPLAADLPPENNSLDHFPHDPLDISFKK